MSAADSTALVEYRPIPNFTGYRVGNDGSVWSCWTPHGMSSRWHRLKPKRDKDGYLAVRLCRGPRFRRDARVHCLVLEAFVGPCPAGMVACHDPDPSRDNCNLSNLRWDTQKNNLTDKIKHGTAQRGERASNVSLTEETVLKIRADYKAGVTSYAELARRYKTSSGAAWFIVKRRNWNHI